MVVVIIGGGICGLGTALLLARDQWRPAFLAVADAWAWTNPSAGRGLTVGFAGAAAGRPSRRARHPQDLVEEFDGRTEVEMLVAFVAFRVDMEERK
jgi:glycine/D-amino acid oxidase-like deaminating enzyme